jgi:capsular exopolysaccharide synthesis family protein
MTDGNTMKINPALLEDALQIKLTLSGLPGEYPVRSIMTASAGHKEGGTCLAVNLALAFAMDERAQVLLIDANPRSPGLHDRFDLEKEAGLLDYISGHTPLQAVIKETAFSNVKVMTIGQTSARSAVNPFVGVPQAMKADLEKDFDRVVYDAAPVNHYPDARLLTRLVDGVVLVIRAEKTRNKDAKRALKSLETMNVRILGGVLNEFQ